jgi:hypothetical protein
MNVDPATAKLGWKEAAERRNDPYNRLSSNDDLKNAFDTLIRLQSSSRRKKEVIMEVANLVRNRPWLVNFTEPTTESTAKRKDDQEAREAIRDCCFPPGVTHSSVEAFLRRTPRQEQMVLCNGTQEQASGEARRSRD